MTAPGRDDTTAAGVCPDCRTALRGQPAGCDNPGHAEAARLPYPQTPARWKPAATPGRDELREQIAAAMVVCAKQFSLNALDGAPLTGRIGNYGTANEFDLADAVLPVVQAHLDRTQDKRAQLLRDIQDLTDIIDARRNERTKLRATVARVRALCDEAEGLLKSRYVRSDDLRAALDPPTERQT